MTNKNLNVWIEAAFAAIISLLISFIPIEVGPSFGVSLGVVGIFVFSFRRGAKAGILAGFLWGVLKVLTGTADILTPIQGILEYLFAFGFAGIAGFWKESIQQNLQANRTGNVLLTSGVGTFVAMGLQYFIHFLAGIFFWGQFAPEGMSAVKYSLVMNSLSGGSTWVAGWVVTFLLIRMAPKLLFARK